MQQLLEFQLIQFLLWENFVKNKNFHLIYYRILIKMFHNNMIHFMKNFQYLVLKVLQNEVLLLLINKELLNMLKY